MNYVLLKTKCITTKFHHTHSSGNIRDLRGVDPLSWSTVSSPSVTAVRVFYSAGKVLLFSDVHSGAAVIRNGVRKSCLDVRDFEQSVYRKTEWSLTCVNNGDYVLVVLGFHGGWILLSFLFDLNRVRLFVPVVDVSTPVLTSSSSRTLFSVYTRGGCISSNHPALV